MYTQTVMIFSRDTILLSREWSTDTKQCRKSELNLMTSLKSHFSTFRQRKSIENTMLRHILISYQQTAMKITFPYCTIHHATHSTFASIVYSSSIANKHAKVSFSPWDNQVNVGTYSSILVDVSNVVQDWAKIQLKWKTTHNECQLVNEYLSVDDNSLSVSLFIHWQFFYLPLK